MKKQLVLAFTLLFGGLALPANAQCYRQPTIRPGIFILSYHPCGTPIYAKRVFCRGQWQVVRVNDCEVRRHLQRSRAIAAQQAYRSHHARKRVRRARFHHYRPVRRRCR